MSSEHASCSPESSASQCDSLGPSCIEDRVPIFDTNTKNPYPPSGREQPFIHRSPSPDRSALGADTDWCLPSPFAFPSHVLPEEYSEPSTAEDPTEPSHELSPLEESFSPMPEPPSPSSNPTDLFSPFSDLTNDYPTFALYSPNSPAYTDIFGLDGTEADTTQPLSATSSLDDEDFSNGLALFTSMHPDLPRPVDFEREPAPERKDVPKQVNVPPRKLKKKKETQITICVRPTIVKVEETVLVLSNEVSDGVMQVASEGDLAVQPSVGQTPRSLDEEGVLDNVVVTGCKRLREEDEKEDLEEEKHDMKRRRTGLTSRSPSPELCQGDDGLSHFINACGAFVWNVYGR